MSGSGGYWGENAGAVGGGRVSVFMREAVSAGVRGGEGGTDKTRTVSAEMLTGRDTCGISRET